MARVVMQARSSADGQLYSWLADTADWAAVGYTGPGTAEDVALSGGGIGDTVDTSGFIVNGAGAFLLNATGVQLITNPAVDLSGFIFNAGGAQLINAGGAQLINGRPSLVNAGGAGLVNATSLPLFVGH